MENFKAKFKEEAEELIQKLEQVLIKVEDNFQDKESIGEIFRIMHTLKGSAGMFGFEKTGMLTHRMEDIYHAIRDGESQLSEEIVDLTLGSLDLLKELLKTDEKLPKKSKQELEKLLIRAIDYVPEENEKETKSESEETGSGNKKYDDEKETGEGNFFYILFQPQKDILSRGIDITSVFYELDELGEFFGFPILENVPETKDFVPEDFYLGWDLFIYTNGSKEEISDVFLFFLDHEYTIVPVEPDTLETNKEFTEKCVNLKNKKTSLNDIKSRLEALTPKKKSKTKKEDEAEKEEIINEKETAEEINEKDPIQALKDKKENETIKVKASKLDELINLVSDLVTINSRVETISQNIENADLKKAVQSISKLSKRFRDNALELRLIPVKVLILKMQRLIRDLSKQLGKEVEFVTEGTQTELDKNIIAKLEGPLLHIIRNSLDHAIEDPDERERNNKPGKGVIRFIAFYSGAHVFIQIQDDGRGIDTEKIKAKAVEKGLIEKNAQLTKQELYNLLFQPGFSTAEKVTQVSGRGVGMDTVKKEINDMRGQIDIDSEIKLGTSVTLKLPLTLSIIDTLMTKVKDTTILIPVEFIVQTQLNTYKDKKQRPDQVDFNNNPIPLIPLRKDFDENGDIPEKEKIIIVRQYDRHYAITVDRIIGEHQAVVKPLGHYQKDHPYFSGSSILGDGSLALILDINKIISNKKNQMESS
jgi:two-component system chemotaxis sensor kinase CheA